MGFKDQLNKDLSVFVNSEEFAESISIDGEQTDVVIDSDMLREYNLKNGGEGLAKGEVLFFVPVSSLKEEPFIGKRMRLNNKIYEIIDVKKDLYMYAITLAGYRS